MHHPHRSSFPPAYSQLKHALGPLENSRFCFFCPLSALRGADRAELPAEADQGTGKQPWKEDRIKYVHALHCPATTGLTWDAAPAQMYTKILVAPKLNIRNADIVSVNHSN